MTSSQRTRMYMYRDLLKRRLTVCPCGARTRRINGTCSRCYLAHLHDSAAFYRGASRRDYDQPPRAGWIQEFEPGLCRKNIPGFRTHAPTAKGEAKAMSMKHIVGFSGGIDSQACARWVLNRYPAEDVILTNSNAGGNEHPLTVEFVEWYSTNVHPVVTTNAIIGDMWITPGFAETKGYDSNAPLDFATMAAIKGRFPSRVAQFCTEYLKLVPQRRWIKTTFDGTGLAYQRYTGVRRDESASRASTVFLRWDDYFDCNLIAPCFDWTKQMCFDFVKAHGEKVNPLYTLGFNRVGCAPCVNSGKDDIVNWSERAPEMIEKIERWEAQTGRTFFYAIRIPGRKAPIGVRDVVAWARTARGGKQELFPIMHERDACESKYGLCE